jgi:Ca2+-binding RTX toxin-like protein
VTVLPHNGIKPLDGVVWVLPHSGSPVLAASSEGSNPLQALGVLRRGDGSSVTVDPLGSGGAVDSGSKTLLGGTPHDVEGLGSGDEDVLVLAGGEGAAIALAPAGSVYERIVLLGGSDYSLATADGNVDAGRVLTVVATALGARHKVDFDGSAEKDGSFVFHGGEGSDRFTGGAGADVIYGLGGGDRLTGGGGADRFVYTRASESSGRNHDTLADFNFAQDKIDLPVSVSGIAAAVSKGSLSAASFDADLAKALSGLGAGQAGLFTADKGDLAGKTFLVVDGNGQAGYQSGADYVFLLETPPPADLGGTGFFV